MKRREFFKVGLIGATLPTLTFGNSELKRNQNSPVIITTHNFPKANAAAIEVLKKYGSSMDAAEAGCKAIEACLLYTSPSPRDLSTSRMPSSA